MTTMVAEPATASSAPSPPGPSGAVLPAAMAAEWIKLRSIRSTLWSLLAAVGICVGLAALLCWAYVHRFNHLDPAERLRLDATLHSLRGIFLAQLAIGVLGVLFIGSEHGTGMIRATFAAVPQRRTVLIAKAIVLGATTLVVGAVAAPSAFFVGQSVLASKHVEASLGDPGVLWAVVGGAVYFPAIALLAFALGAIIRRTAGAIATLFGLVLVLPILAEALPSPWNHDVSKYLPGGAGQAMFSVRPREELLSPGSAALVLAAWVAGLLAIALVLVTRRDA
jgi:hypothetical protein